jgi:hypothetical protein
MLSGCEAGNRLAGFSAGDAPLDRKLPVACEAFLVPVEDPKVTAQTDAAIADLRDHAAYKEANGRIIDARDCTSEQRQDYAEKAASK